MWLLPASQDSDFVTACMLYISLGLALMYLGNHHDCLIAMHRGFCTIMLHYYSDDHNIHSILLSEDHFFEIHSTQYYTIITEKKICNDTAVYTLTMINVTAWLYFITFSLTLTVLKIL